MTEAEREKSMQEGQAMKELQRQEGWKILTDRIEKDVKSALLEMRTTELEGKSLQDIGAEFVSQIKLIEGLERVLDIVKDIEARGESATL